MLLLCVQAVDPTVRHAVQPVVLPSCASRVPLATL